MPKLERAKSNDRKEERLYVACPGRRLDWHVVAVHLAQVHRVHVCAASTLAGPMTGAQSPRLTPTRDYQTAWCARVKAVKAASGPSSSGCRRTVLTERSRQADGQTDRPTEGKAVSRRSRTANKGIAGARRRGSRSGTLAAMADAVLLSAAGRGCVCV